MRKETGARLIAYILWVIAIIATFCLSAFISDYFFGSSDTVKLVSTIFLDITILFGGIISRVGEYN